MSELQETEKPENLQDEVEKVWQDRHNWNDGQEYNMEGLPEGLRIIETDSHTLVLRSIIPNAPQSQKQEDPDDVPVGIFSTLANPDEIKKEALKIGTAIIKGEIRINEAKIPDQIKNPK